MVQASAVLPAGGATLGQIKHLARVQQLAEAAQHTKALEVRHSGSNATSPELLRHYTPDITVVTAHRSRFLHTQSLLHGSHYKTQSLLHGSHYTPDPCFTAVTTHLAGTAARVDKNAQQLRGGGRLDGHHMLFRQRCQVCNRVAAPAAVSARHRYTTLASKNDQAAAQVPAWVGHHDVTWRQNAVAQRPEGAGGRHASLLVSDARAAILRHESRIRANSPCRSGVQPCCTTHSGTTPWATATEWRGDTRCICLPHCPRPKSVPVPASVIGCHAQGSRKRGGAW